MIKKRVDSNQSQVTNELRELGFSVGLTHIVGKGFPDFVVGYMGINYLVELKSDDTKKLTKDEVVFHDEWCGQVNIHYTTKDIIEGIYINQLLINGLYDETYVLNKLKTMFVKVS